MKVCASITEATASEALKAMEDAASWADLLEIRLDHLAQGRPDLETIKAVLTDPPKPCLVTNRMAAEGGRFAGDENDRLDLLEKALAFKPAMIDLELAAGPEAISRFSSQKGDTALVLSFHDFEKTPPPEELKSILKDMNRLGADVAKLVTKAENPEQVLWLKELYESAKNLGQPLAAFALGPLSKLSRVLSPLWGNALSYCAPADGKQAAPGQMTGAELRRIYPAGKAVPAVTHATRLFAVLGNPVGHSLSPVLHNAAFRHLGLDCFYVPMEIEDVTLAIEAWKAFGFEGLSVTRPHKLGVIAGLDRQEDTALNMGAVNTITKKNSEYIGANTDVGGMLEALKKKIDPAEKKVIVAGAGGAARAAVYGLTQAGAKVSVTNRTESKGRELADAFGAEFLPAGDLETAGAEILVNATPLGMAGMLDETPFPIECLKNGPVVMDMVYAPTVTKLITQAEENKCPVVFGLSMLLHQAALQFQTWTGQDAPFEVMERAAQAALNGDKN